MHYRCTKISIQMYLDFPAHQEHGCGGSDGGGVEGLQVIDHVSNGVNALLVLVLVLLFMLEWGGEGVGERGEERKTGEGE